MSKPLNRATLKRLDDASVVKMLTTFASVWADRGLLSGHDADNLRISLSGLQLDTDQDASALVRLQRQNDEFLTVLINRYGSIGLCQNVFRYTLQLALAESEVVLNNLGELLLEKAQVLFNRPFDIFLGGTSERRTLFSTVLVDMADVIQDSCQRLTTSRQDLSFLVAKSMGPSWVDEDDMDAAVAEQIGFQGVSSEALPFLREERARTMITSSLGYMAKLLYELVEQLRFNRNKDDTSKALMLCEAVQSELQLLSAFSFPKSDDVGVWELRRESFLSSLRNLNQLVRNLCEEFRENLTRLSSVQGASKQLPSRDILRGVSSTMIIKGTPPLKAQAAACALVKYCEEHGIHAKDILSAELPKIDPNLTEAGLKTLQDEQAGHGNPQEKHANLERQKVLMVKFHERLAALGVLIALMILMIPGCGVKLAPKSSLIDHRPRVDYHLKRKMPEYMQRDLLKKDDEKDSSPEDLDK